MSNKINKYLNKSSFAKLLLFNWVQTRNSGLFWILLLLNCIALPLTSCLLYYLTEDFLHYTIFIILVPLISSFIQIMFLVYWLYLENKHNSIDYKLFCSQYSRFHIALARIIFIVITLIPIIIINDLFSIFFIFTSSFKFFGAMILSNTFINVFMYVMIICLLVLFSDRMGRVSYIFLGLFLAIITLGGSLISRPFIITQKDNYLNYENIGNDNYPFKTTKLISNDLKDILLMQNSSSSLLTQSDIVYFVNKKSVFYNNFIPSEWTLTFYSSLFSLFNFQIDYSKHPYNLLATNVKNNVNDDFNNLSSFYAIRPIDVNFLTLSNNDYENLILNNIDKIINKYNLLSNESLLSDFSNIFEINKLTYSISNWNTLNDNAINFLKDATGINTEFNQLFYLIKYNNLINVRLDNLFNFLSEKYNLQISTLFKNVLTSPITMINLFQVSKFDMINLVLKTEKFIYDIYPEIEIEDINKKITINDKNFLKNQLFKFNLDNNSLMFLSSELKYIVPSQNELMQFQNKYPMIKDQTSWENVVEILSENYNTANNFLSDIRTIFRNLFNYTLMGNSLDLSFANAILNPVNGNQNGYGEIFIIGYIGLFILLTWLTIKKYQSYYNKQ